MSDIPTPGTKSSIFVETRLLNVEIPFVWDEPNELGWLFVRANLSKLHDILRNTGDWSSAWDTLNRMTNKLSNIYGKRVCWKSDDTI